jgi:hypothetical protein
LETTQVIDSCCGLSLLRREYSRPVVDEAGSFVEWLGWKRTFTNRQATKFQYPYSRGCLRINYKFSILINLSLIIILFLHFHSSISVIPFLCCWLPKNYERFHDDDVA